MASSAYRVQYENNYWSGWYTEEEFLSILKNVGVSFKAVEVSQRMTRKELIDAGVIPANSLIVGNLK